MSISHRLREKNVCLFNPVEKVDPKFVSPWDTPRKPNPLSSGEIQRGQNSQRFRLRCLYQKTISPAACLWWIFIEESIRLLPIERFKSIVSNDGGTRCLIGILSRLMPSVLQSVQILKVMMFQKDSVRSLCWSMEELSI